MRLPLLVVFAFGLSYGIVIYRFYLHVGDPATDRDWDESVEGDGISYGADGGLLGYTILNARRRVKEDGELVTTLPEQRVVAKDLGNVFVART